MSIFFAFRYFTVLISPLLNLFSRTTKAIGVAFLIDPSFSDEDSERSKTLNPPTCRFFAMSIISLLSVKTSGAPSKAAILPDFDS